MAMKTKKSPRGRTPDGQPNPIDVHVGERIRLRRTLLRLSQTELADMLGVTFQQVQKYERGSNRVSASRLWDISKVLQAPITFFYEDMEAETAQNSPRNLASRNLDSLVIADSSVGENDPMQSSEAIELVKAYFKINHRQTAQSLFDAMVSCSKAA
ncbi:MAG: helix-turn-helix transcriptional regulator [Alphaproteobacteria bacterium]|nr:helix-turn-helix transcriptional regulator [Alphaproteobacteria bacterium]